LQSYSRFGKNVFVSIKWQKEEREMKEVILAAFILLQAQSAFASQNLTCSATEGSTGLGYLTRIESLTNASAERVDFYFITQGIEHLFCISVAPFQVSKQGDVFTIRGEVECEDSSEYRSVEVKFDSSKMTLDTGARTETCVFSD